MFTCHWKSNVVGGENIYWKDVQIGTIKFESITEAIAKINEWRIGSKEPKYSYRIKCPDGSFIDNVPKEGEEYDYAIQRWIGYKKENAAYTQQYVDDFQPETTKFYSLTKENTNMASKSAFEYIAILHSEPQRDAQGNDVTPDSKVIAQSTSPVIASSMDHIMRIAARQIPKEVSDSDLARVEIKIKGF